MTGEDFLSAFVAIGAEPFSLAAFGLCEECGQRECDHHSAPACVVPVLRWQADGDGYRAELGPWTLLVDPDWWRVGVDAVGQGFVVIREDAFASSFQTLCESRGAAETALRELGVVFRTEGEL